MDDNAFRHLFAAVFAAVLVYVGLFYLMRDVLSHAFVRYRSDAQNSGRDHAVRDAGIAGVATFFLFVWLGPWYWLLLVPALLGVGAYTLTNPKAKSQIAYDVAPKMNSYSQALRLSVQAGDEEKAKDLMQRYLPCYLAPSGSLPYGLKMADLQWWNGVVREDVNKDITTPLAEAILHLTRLKRGITVAAKYQVPASILSDFQQSTEGGLRAVLDTADKVVDFAKMGYDYDNVRDLLMREGLVLQKLSGACEQSEKALVELTLSSNPSAAALHNAEAGLASLGAAVQELYSTIRR